MPSAYDSLLARLKRIHALDRAAGRLRWDQEVVMPTGGTEARAGELSTLASLSHELLTDAETGELLEAAEADAEAPDQQALLREARLRYERSTRVPGELVEALSEASSRAFPAWVEAKEAADWSLFEEHMANVVELRRRYARAIDAAADPYEVLFQDYEPWLPYEQASSTLAELRGGLVELVEAAPPAQQQDPGVFDGRWPAAQQRALSDTVLDALGYDRQRGRLDESAHPFTSGNRYDVRVTTRYEEDDPVAGLTSTIHEFGHAFYTQGLPEAHFGTPLGEDRDLVVHESQSRLWENHVGRSRAFWRWLAPHMREAFPQRASGLTAEQGWRAANVVRPSLVRVDSDELTYHLHIVLRTEIEQALVRGEMEVDEVPEVWNSKMEAYLGLSPPDDARGCLQDVHWSHAALGYFPTYSLGSLLAAQLFQAFQDQVEGGDRAVDEMLETGIFDPLASFLRERVHRHGARYTTPELIERATGGPLTPEAFLAYARRKYGQLWDADL